MKHSSILILIFFIIIFPFSSIFSQTANLAPITDSAPRAYNLFIQGEYYGGQILTGSYTYYDASHRPEGKSIYHWYRADSISQPIPLQLADSTVNHVVDSILDFHKYLAFEITPVAKGTGDSLVGKPARAWTGLIGGVGFDALSRVKPGIFPNPASGFITLTELLNINKIEIFSISGQNVLSVDVKNSNTMTLDVSYLNQGQYFVRFSKTDHTFITGRFVRK